MNRVKNKHLEEEKLKLLESTSEIHNDKNMEDEPKINKKTYKQREDNIELIAEECVLGFVSSSIKNATDTGDISTHAHTHARTQASKQASTHTRAHTRRHACMHACTHAHTQTRTHTCTHKQLQICL